MFIDNRNTKQWQKIDSDHHLHPFTDHKLLSTSGSKIITSAKGNYVFDSEGNEYYEVDYLAQDMVYKELKNDNYQNDNVPSI